MLYAFLCIADESEVASWTREQDDAVLGRLAVVKRKLEREGRFGCSLRLMPTTAATTLVKQKGLVLDGPYAETKEALLGLYVIECGSLDQALATARELGEANPAGVYEIRPLRGLTLGSALESAAEALRA